ncbi:phytanoyl-CoA dioxygenase family protein [filamentous cyanobacterium LEGE 11480]|uniref:Phytanoyl-CoA dioxygenase family protein n=1 Tax=Romeriopsis navalis LEGE 11480 TaxID=2777977 RepID=A0A928Z0W2_9CYAN|nr:phytanoyl-CoA dioxygenase family protein [Romeriopsis navalis]MBE9028696.1 phytanoyl-CoA dioxygenase family protein [Romeriopsis navalis LEGE 11480]
MNHLAIEIAARPPIPLTAEQEALLPTAADIEFFETHGWYVSPPVLPESIFETVMQGCDRFYRGERDATIPQAEFANWSSTDDDSLRNHEFVARQMREFQAIALNPIIGAIAARLTRNASMRLFEEQLIYKPPQGNDAENVIGWHTDFAYCSFCNSTTIAAWVPLQDVDVDMGPLVVIDGSHKWEEFHELRNFCVADLDSLESELAAAGRTMRPVPMAIKKGQISFHHHHAIHGSYPNHSDRPRIALPVHLQDGNNQFNPIPNPKGGLFHHHLDRFCRRLANGHPDYADPTVFPLIWDEATYQRQPQRQLESVV